jgi:hypothetical protein
MSTNSDLHNIIKKLQQKMAEAKRFNKVIEQEIKQIDVNLERLKRKKKG